ncbi:hypothetical protein [Prosthecobacter sp.]|jgi:hypothetical protein|uniref:hypothetical protein n=1 Tax=Prosthecobacter sp. TaxID=1965333 RepID=UPI003782E668
MRGFPPIQIFLLCLAFIVLAVPLSHLTGNTSNAKVVKVAVKEVKSVKALLRLRFAHKPTTLSLKLADKELITTANASPLELDAVLPSTKDGVDVFLSATWPENTPDTALTLEIEPDGLEARSETRWSAAGSLDEVITFSWK